MSADIAEVKPLCGGSISSTVLVKTQKGERAVLKISPHRVDHSYVNEAYQLNVLRGIGIPTPQVYGCKVGDLDQPFSYLLMEHVDGVDLADARNQCNTPEYDHLQMHLAELMRTIHSQTHSHYTRVTDGDRQEFEKWHEFYLHIYAGIWNEAQKVPSMTVKMRKQITRIHDRLDILLAGVDCPRLTHSDLWSANVLAKKDQHGKWYVTAILDPNCKYAHFESELAYLELFKTTNSAFMRAYQENARLPNEYHIIRKPVYQLYELLNHLQLFGAEYFKPIQVGLDMLTRFV